MSLIVIAQNITDPETHALARKDGTACYDVEVSINRKRFIWTGKIDSHARDTGAAALLRLIADKIDEQERLSDVRPKAANPRIMRNSAKCLECGEEIESTFRHDYRYCKCGNVFVDGGRAYIRAGWRNRETYQDTSVIDEYQEQQDSDFD